MQSAITENCCLFTESGFKADSQISVQRRQCQWLKLSFPRFLIEQSTLVYTCQLPALVTDNIEPSLFGTDSGITT